MSTQNYIGPVPSVFPPLLSLSLYLAAICATPVAGAYEWETISGGRRAKLPVPQSGQPGFQKMNPVLLGVLFTNQVSSNRSILNRNLLNGSGVAAGDVDGDGWCDLYFCGLETDNALYRNLGNWKFENVTKEAGVACSGQDSTGATFADIDGDGDLDLLVTGLGTGVRIFKNDGRGHFTEVTAESGVASQSGSMSLALADVDGDGDLDLYVANYRPNTVADIPTITYTIQMVDRKPVVAKVNGQPATLSQWTNRFEVSASANVLELGEPDVLYLNDGTGKFSPVSFTDGSFLDEDGKPLKEAPRDWGLAVQMHDLNGDGAPDIYVCNDFWTPDRIWINNGKGQFRAIARTAIRSTSTFSMGVDFADINRDGYVDFFVVDMLSPDHIKRNIQLGEKTMFRWPVGAWDNRPQNNNNTLQLGRGDGTFAECAFYAGVEASDWSWGPIFLDVDLDGYEDILVANGQMRDFQNIDKAVALDQLKTAKRMTQSEILRTVGQFPTLETPNVIYRNRGDGTFEEKGAAWGFAAPGISQGMALADLDNDGDMDVIINNFIEPATIYRNEGVAPRITVRLKGSSPNRAGIGAKIKVEGGQVTQSQEMIAGGRYLSGDEAIRAFAAGNATNQLKIEVAWRDGKRSFVSALANYIYEIDEGTTSPADQPRMTPPEPWFEPLTNLPAVTHVEEPFNDLERQPLLIKYLSQLGPGVCWHDYNQDGWDDLIVGSGRGGHLTILQNQQGNGFTAISAPGNRPVARDETTILGLNRVLLAGSSNYEDGGTNGGLVKVFDFERNASGDSILGHSFSVGPLALADIDADGDLDLFIGGRVNPGRYPEAADSLLLKNEGGKLVVAQRWEKLGLVSGAVFSDLDQDGYPELILATEWGPVRVFKLVNGKYEERTQEWGLAGETGWWNGVTTGDFDGDGKLEIVASNWGLNSPYRATHQYPRKVYFGDIDGNGTVDLIEARYSPALGKEVPERTFNVVGAAMPYLHGIVPTYEAYGSRSMPEIFGEPLRQASVLEADNFASTIFVNRGGKFTAQSLPIDAQLSPAFGICAVDLDGDGAEDLFLSQNFFALAPNEPRSDAGRGLCLKGDGHGNFAAVPGQESGIAVYGEQRGCAISDFDGDGRVDLAVTQNANATKVFHNLHARPGLRVRLKGPPGNLGGIGAQLRLEDNEIKGPVREIQAGSGYWSQNSVVQVMNLTSPHEPARIWIRWPGGKTTSSEIPKAAKEIEVSPNGVVRLVR